MLFIDEIHRLSASVEVLYPAMEDYQLDIMIGESPRRGQLSWLPPFTLVGAAHVQVFLQVRCVTGLELFSVWSCSEQTWRRSSRDLPSLWELTGKWGSLEIARRSRGTPRIANRLLRRVRDFAEVRADGVVTVRVADDALNLLHVDERGFDQMDRKLLSVLANHFDGGPVGIESLATSLGEERGTLEEVIEPYLYSRATASNAPRSDR